MKLTLFKKKTPILLGVDISPSSVKVLELSNNAQGYQVESYAIKELPQLMQEKEFKNVKALGQVLKDVVKHSQTKAQFCAVGVRGSSVITKEIQMNADLSENDLVVQLSKEAQKHIPYPMSEINMDFQVLGPSTKDPDKLDVLLAASRTEMIESLIEIVNLGGLVPKIIDIEAYSIARAFGLIANQLPKKEKYQTIAVVNIGASMTSLCVLNGKKTVYARDQLFGGKQLTEEIQRHYGLTYEEANMAKKDGKLPENYTFEILKPFNDAMGQTISRLLQFFFSSGEYVRVDHIMLAGEGCTCDLVKHMEEKLKIPASLANPFINMTLSPRVRALNITADAPSLMICCGLALRSFVHEHQS